MRLGNLVTDLDRILQARRLAEDLLSKDPELNEPANRRYRSWIKGMFGEQTAVVG